MSDISDPAKSEQPASQTADTSPALLHSDHCVVEVEGHKPRTFRLQLSGLNGGGFLSTIEYNSDNPGESAISIREEADNLEEVERFFYVFETVDAMPTPKGLDEKEKQEHTRSFRRFSKEYEDLLYRFLDQAQKKIAEIGCSDRVVKGESQEGFLWRLFKAK